MNKEGLTADLVCMIEERSLPRNLAKFKEQIERFFVAGGARIDLIAKVIDLDNAIGGYNFDIPNLEETSNKIESLRNSGGKDRWLVIPIPMCHLQSKAYGSRNEVGRQNQNAWKRLYI